MIFLNKNLSSNSFLTFSAFFILSKSLSKAITFEFGYSNKNQIEKMYNTFIPNKKENFEDFYKKIRHLKITTAILQKFLFGNMKCNNIIEEIHELEKLCNENTYDIKNSIYN